MSPYERDCEHARRRVARGVRAKVSQLRITSFVRVGPDGEHYSNGPEPEDLPLYARLVTCVDCGTVLDRKRGVEL